MKEVTVEDYVNNYNSVVVFIEAMSQESKDKVKKEYYRLKSLHPNSIDNKGIHIPDQRVETKFRDYILDYKNNLVRFQPHKMTYLVN